MLAGMSVWRERCGGQLLTRLRESSEDKLGSEVISDRPFLAKQRFAKMRPEEFLFRAIKEKATVFKGQDPITLSFYEG